MWMFSYSVIAVCNTVHREGVVVLWVRIVRCLDTGSPGRLGETQCYLSRVGTPSLTSRICKNYSVVCAELVLSNAHMVAYILYMVALHIVLFHFLSKYSTKCGVISTSRQLCTPVPSSRQAEVYPRDPPLLGQWEWPQLGRQDQEHG